MAQTRNMHEHEAERVRDLWLQMCAEAGTPLPESSAQLILQSLGWENDMTIYSIYGNVPGDPALQRVWYEYEEQR